MSEYTVSHFMSETCAAMEGLNEPADYVEAIAPMLHRLINGPRTFLKPEHFRQDDDHYARNAVYVDSKGRHRL